MSFNYTRDIPFPSNNPSQDAPNMRINTNSIDNIWGVDHVNFNDTNSGKHKQVTFISENTPGAQVDPASTLFTGTGTASSVAELFYANQSATFLMSCIKAFGVFQATGAPAFSNQYNCKTIAFSNPSYLITLNSNVVTGNNVLVLLSQSNAGATFSWSFANPVLTISNPSNNALVSFVVIQA